MKRKFLISVISIILILALCVGIVMLVQHLTKKPKLSSLSEEECVAYMEAHGFHVPKQLQEGLPALIAKIEGEDGYLIRAYGNTNLVIYYDKIKMIVADYYGVEGIETLATDEWLSSRFEQWLELRDQ